MLGLQSRTPFFLFRVELKLNDMGLRDFGFSIDDNFSCVVLKVSDLRVLFALALQALLQSLEILHSLPLSLPRSFLLFEDGLINKLLTLISFQLILASKLGLLHFLPKMQRNLFLQLYESFLLSLNGGECLSLADMASRCSFLLYFLDLELIMSVAVVFCLSPSHLHC